MTYTIEERFKDRRSEDTSSATLSREYELNATEKMTEAEATAAFVDYLDDHNIRRLNSGLRIARFEVEATEESYDEQWVARVEWTGTAKTSEYPEQTVDILAETFSTKGGTARITQAIDETRYPANGQTLPDMKGGIGWNGDEFEGCDVVCPAFSFTLEKSYDYDSIDATDKTYWADMTGCVNSDTFRGFDAGTVLFMGVSGQSNIEYQGDLVNVSETVDGETVVTTYKKATVTYKCQFEFRCQPNNSAFQTAGVSVNKKGWQYVWTLRELSDDAAAGQTVKAPLGVYVNTVYPVVSFADLL